MYLDYANGHIGDWGIHWFDQVLWWTDELHPKTVFSTGGRYRKADSSDAPDTQYALFEFESFTLEWENKRIARNANETHNVGCYFYGSEGTLHMGWLDGWTFYPRNKHQDPVNFPHSLHKPDWQNIPELWADFMQAIEQDRHPLCDIEDGYRATNLSLLGMISYRLKRSLSWDGPNHRILNDPESTAMMRREYRGDWVYPVLKG